MNAADIISIILGLLGAATELQAILSRANANGGQVTEEDSARVDMLVKNAHTDVLAKIEAAGAQNG